MQDLKIIVYNCVFHVEHVATGDKTGYSVLFGRNLAVALKVGGF